MSVGHEALPGPAADLIGGRWIEIPGKALCSRNPAHPGEVVWSGSPRIEHVELAVAAARAALPEWSRWTADRRAEVLREFKAIASVNAERLSTLIRDEVGKATWDARSEASLLSAKVDATLDERPMGRVRDFEIPLSGTRVGRCVFRPHGVMAVIGPFNFPAHLPNGHIVPALLMGNTVVFKPSDKAPGVGQFLAWLFQQALDRVGAPAGVLNLVQGGSASASRLASGEGPDGILFTGSWPVGRKIMEANLDRPGRILALEMGGNSAAIVLGDAELRDAVVECARSAFVTSGQRCTCTRRVIVEERVADRVIGALARVARGLRVGDPRGAVPGAVPGAVFMGPMISRAARDAVLDAQSRFERAGGEVIVRCEASDADGGWYLSPGLMRVGRFDAGASGGAGCDEEVFGPLLRVSVASSLDDALSQANATMFGLAASIFTKDEGAIARFLGEARAGCLNVNTGTAGASGRLPFGGLGRSGNHRPAGSFALDYCAVPVASMIERGGKAVLPEGMAFEDAWL